MSNLTKLLLGLLGVFILSLICTSCHHQQIEGKLQDAVMTRLSSNPDYKNIQVKFNGAQGTLIGAVGSPEIGNQALAEARDAVGFLFPVSSNYDDAGGGATTNLTISMDPSGKVVLKGVVPDEATKAAVLKAAQDKFGADKVVDQLSVQAGLKPFGGDLAAVVAAYLGQASKIQDGALKIAGNGLAITGRVPDDSVKQAIGDAVKTAFPNGIIGNDLMIQPTSNPQLQTDLNALSMENIEFETGSAAIKPASQEVVKKAAEYLKKYAGNAVEIQGHTDSQGKPEKNQALSEQRAQAVKQALVALGVPNPNRLTAKGYGASSPVADNTTAEGRGKNRRVVFIVQ